MRDAWKNSKAMKYVFDAGHSAKTKGKRSPDGRLLEYAYNREIVRRVRAALEERGIESFVTYNLDAEYDLALSKRAEAANRIARKYGAGNTLLISIHVNASKNGEWGTAKGWSIWTTKGQNNSDRYAEKFVRNAEIECAKVGRRVRKDLSDGDGDYEANFTVIKNTICPSVLIENFFMDTKEEMEWLLTEEGKQTCTNIVVKTIEDIEAAVS